MFKKYYFFIFLIVTTNVLLSQLKKGDNYAQKNMYIKAIRCYKKAINTKNTNEKQTALIKLANAYKTINDYQLSVRD